ncbi:MAG: 50S ribosomal protein L30 [Flavobacteriales bacterium]|nr:50S ribosomal protein L30 [Flavobacteriales bacterium]|tara:strand:+ start:6358 stop:6534 length:177 start_codon:yes stop_codon:yes gene_type:complete
MAKIKITQVRSAINYPKKQKDTLKALGISKLNQTVEKEENPQILGMVRAVEHLVKVEK